MKKITVQTTNVSAPVKDFHTVDCSQVLDTSIFLSASCCFFMCAALACHTEQCLSHKLLKTPVSIYLAITSF